MPVFGKHGRFRLIARSIGVFIQCQMPVDASGHVQLRTLPNALGHVKDAPGKSSSTLPASPINPTKQAEQAMQGLESLQNNKQYSHLIDQVVHSVQFLSDRNFTLQSCSQLLMWLGSQLYPEFRYLDVLRVCHV